MCIDVRYKKTLLETIFTFFLGYMQISYIYLSVFIYPPWGATANASSQKILLNGFITALFKKPVMERRDVPPD